MYVCVCVCVCVCASEERKIEREWYTHAYAHVFCTLLYHHDSSWGSYSILNTHVLFYCSLFGLDSTIRLLLLVWSLNATLRVGKWLLLVEAQVSSMMIYYTS